MKMERLALVEVEGAKFVVIEDHLSSPKMGLRRGCITICIRFGMTLVNTSENTVSNVIVYCVQSVSVEISTIYWTLKSLDNFIFINVGTSYLFRFTSTIVTRNDFILRLRSPSCSEICMKYLHE